MIAILHAPDQEYHGTRVQLLEPLTMEDTVRIKILRPTVPWLDVGEISRCSTDILRPLHLLRKERK